MIVDDKKIKSRIIKFGPTTLDILVNWFPQCNTKEIENIIYNTIDLQIKDGVVCIKNITKDFNNISYEQLLDIISKYNEDVKKDFETNYDIHELKIKAIKGFLEDKFLLIDFNINNLYKSYIATNKKNESISYVIICDEFSKQVFDDLNLNFSGKVVQVYYLKATTNTSTVEEFYFRDSNKIIEQMLKKYDLVEKQVNINKIEEQ